MDRARQPGITIHQVYLESASFEHRSDFLELPPHPAPGQLDVELQAEYRISEDGQTGVVRLVVRTNPEADGFYRFNVIVGALLERTSGAENFSIREYADTAGIPMLMPFAREAVANLTGRGRFGPIWIHPFNFVASGAAGEADGPATDRLGNGDDLSAGPHS